MDKLIIHNKDGTKTEVIPCKMWQPPEDMFMKIGNLLMIYRATHGQGVRELAKEIKISPATISRLERGKDIEGKTMIKIITWLFNT